MRMADIYSRAQRVVAWLGQGDEYGLETMAWVTSNVRIDFHDYELTAKSDREEDIQVSTLV